MQSRWLGTAIVALVLIALVLQAGVVARAGFFVGDFRAFYCAAKVASHGADPYHAQPLRACEMTVGSKSFFQKNPGVTIPAPLPGYAIAALVPLSWLPFRVAVVAWLALLALAWIAGVVALARCASVPWEVALCALSLAFGVISLPFGEVVPPAIACICLAAHFARTGRWQAAAVSTAGAMVEPHLGLPAALALAVWAPRSRVPLVIAFAALGLLSLLMLGIGTNLEYFTSVLPAHALSEATRDTQYSLTAVLTAIGVPAVASVKAGAAWYLVMLAFGTLVAGRLAARTQNAAFLACVPPAFAVFGGSFIHITQIAAALPAVVLLASYVRRGYAAVAVIALLLLAVPWGWAVSPALIVAPLVPVAYLAWHYLHDRLAAALIAGIASAALVLGLQYLYAVKAPRIGVPTAAPAINAGLAEDSWSRYSRGGSSASLAAWAVRIPTWGGLLVLLVLLTAESAVLRRGELRAWKDTERALSS